MSEWAQLVWHVPTGGTVPDLAELLQARTVPELVQEGDPLQQAAQAAQEDLRASAEAELRAVAADLASKGIKMDPDRALRRPLLERLEDAWFDLTERWRRGAPPPAPPEMPNAQPFAAAIPLASTYATRQIALDHDQIEAEIDRMVEALARQISAQRGRGAMQVSIPEDLVDRLAEIDDLTEPESWALELDTLRGYWPPLGQPALGLSVVQEDGGLPIEIWLLAHDSGGHRRLEAGLAEFGLSFT